MFIEHNDTPFKLATSFSLAESSSTALSVNRRSNYFAFANETENRKRQRSSYLRICSH